MLSKLKIKLLDFLLHRNKREWLSNKPKILIQTNNNGFSEEKWLAFLNEDASLKDEFEIQYCNKKIDYIKLSEEANAIFCFSQSSFINWNRDSLRLVYFGMNGLELIDLDGFSSETKIHYVKGFAAEPIAEYILGTAILVNRNLKHAILNQELRKWEQKSIITYRYKPLKSKVIGVMGVGYIGSVVAEKFAKLDCEVIGFDTNIDLNNPHIKKWYTEEDIDNFLKETDVLIITLPLNKETHHLIDFNRLKQLKQSSIIINTSRGAILQQDKLVEQLMENNLYVVLDVFEEEPLRKKSRLWSQENAILTPHIAGNINIIAREIQEDFISKIQKKLTSNV